MKMYKTAVFVILFLQIILGFLPTTTEALSIPCIDSPETRCPGGEYERLYNEQKTPLQRFFEKEEVIIILVCIVIVLLGFGGYKVVKKWKQLWGLGIYPALFILGLILSTFDISLSFINSPGLFIIKKIHTAFPYSIAMVLLIGAIIVNLIFYTLIGFIIYKIFKKKTITNTNI